MAEIQFALGKVFSPSVCWVRASIVVKPRGRDNTRVVKRNRPVIGKRFILASTEQVDAVPDIAAQFMERIFNLRPGEYLVTDESDLLDFAPFPETGAAEVWSRIEAEYDIGFERVGSGRLIRLFAVIARERRFQ